MLHSVSLCYNSVLHSVFPCSQFSFTSSVLRLLVTFMCHSNSSYHYSSINYSTWLLWWYNLFFRTVTWRNWICWLSSAVWPLFRSWLLSWYD